MSEPWHNVTYDKTYKMQQTKIDQLERENAGLVDKIGNYQYEVDEGQKTIERLEKENEKLKKIATDADNDFWRMKQIFNVRIAQLEEKLKVATVGIR